MTSPSGRTPKNGTHHCRATEIRRLMTAEGWRIEDLAAKAVVDARTIHRILAGKPGSVTKIAALARALGVTPEELIVPATPPPENPHTPYDAAFSLSLSLRGTVSDHSQVQAIGSSLADIVQRLRKHGVTISHCASSLRLSDNAGPFIRRIRFLKCWNKHDEEVVPGVFIAIHPDNYASFVEAVAENIVHGTTLHRYGSIFYIDEARTTKAIAEGPPLLEEPLPRCTEFELFHHDRFWPARARQWGVQHGLLSRPDEANEPLSEAIKRPEANFVTSYADFALCIEFIRDFYRDDPDEIPERG